MKPGNVITLYIDKPGGITVDECGEVNLALEQKLDRDTNDFELNVSSPGLNRPFKVIEQYEKNLGKKVEVIQKSGEKKKGLLRSVNQNEIILETQVKKNKKLESVTATINFGDIKSTRIALDF
jgi:ribosome maturation factor RimP